MNNEQTQRLVAAWRSLWPSAPWRAEDMRLVLHTWTAVLADIDYDEAEIALIAYARDGAAHPPNPGQIAERVLTLRESLDQTAAPTLDRMLREIRHYTQQHEPPPDDWWSHPAVLAAVRSFGWHDLCQMSDTTRAHLIRVYEQARERDRTTRRLAPLLDHTHRALHSGH